MRDITERTVVELQAEMTSGALTARGLAEAYLAQIKALDSEGPLLRAILEVNPEALEIADALDEERHRKGVRGPLHGIPVVLKGNIDTADQMSTTAGSLALKGYIAAKDAFLVRRLRAAGALILGKANLSEWANFRSTRSTSGWSSLGGQTRNPYALDRNPCGSSSGSAVAVAADLCPVAIGTETDGSIICPSQINSIVGIKPTVGLVSRSGIIPIAHSQDTAGPMARTVEDAAILLGALTGIDADDAITSESQGRFPHDYTEFLQEDGLNEARIGVARNFFGFNPLVDQLMERAIGVMKGLGAKIVDPANLEKAGKIRDPEFEVLLYEYKHDLNRYLSSSNDDHPRSLADVITYNEANRNRVMPFFGQEIMLMAEEKGSLEESAYEEARAKCLNLSRVAGIDAVMAEHQLDAIIAPSGSPAWPTDPLNGDHFTGGSSTPAAVAGYPSITVPAGFVFGLPVGISFIGGAYQEPDLIKLAYAYEQATRHRRRPRFLPSVDLTAPPLS